MDDANAKPIVLEVKDLTVNYGVIAALHGISMQIRQGDIVKANGGHRLVARERWNLRVGCGIHTHVVASLSFLASLLSFS